MKKYMNVLILGSIGLTGSFGLGVGAAGGDLEVSGSVQIHARADFEAPLGSLGTWVDIVSYGRCWRPEHLARGWRPYTVGNWAWTDHGWYWSSDEPWAWACYHYGTWADDPTYGWVWVPGTEWGPAWVSWRVGDGYIGWAPLPPPGLLLAHRPPPPAFVFVTAARFADPIRPSALARDPARVLAKSSEIDVSKEGRMRGMASQSVVMNRGPGLEFVQKATGKPIAPVPLQDLARKNPPPASMKPGLPAPTPTGRPDPRFSDELRSAPEHGHAPDRFTPGPERKDREPHGEGHGPGKP
jgi:hypothetical protein